MMEYVEVWQLPQYHKYEKKINRQNSQKFV